MLWQKIERFIYNSLKEDEFVLFFCWGKLLGGLCLAEWIFSPKGVELWGKFCYNYSV